MPDIAQRQEGGRIVLSPLTRAAQGWFIRNVDQRAFGFGLTSPKPDYICDRITAEEIRGEIAKEGLTIG